MRLIKEKINKCFYTVINDVLELGVPAKAIIGDYKVITVTKIKRKIRSSLKSESETQELLAIPGMKKRILKSKKVPLSQCTDFKV